MCYFVGDRSYGLATRLQAEVFDTSEGHEVLDDYALLTIPLYVESKEMDLRFLDRASGAGDYALSLICPAGLLARETDTIEEELEERVPSELGRGLTSRVLADRSQFEQNLALGAFRLDAQSAEVDRETGGKVHLHVPVQELPGAAALHRYEVRTGETVLASHDFEAVAGSDGRLFIEDEVALPEGEEYVQVRVMDASANTRSYTLKVGAPEMRK